MADLLWERIIDASNLGMRYALAFVVFLTVLPFVIAQELPKGLNEQVVFTRELSFEHPTPLPADVLQMLRADERNRQSFHACAKRRKPKEIPADWFIATKVSLKDDEPSAFVVKSNNGCLRGAISGLFWVFRRTGAGYELVLSESALGLELLEARTDGYRDILLTESFADVAVIREYKFGNGKYTLTSKQVHPPRQWLVGRNRL